MTGVRPGIYWQLTWRFVAPVLLTLLVLLSVYKQLFSKAPEYDAWIAEAGKSIKKEFPAWTLVLGAILAVASIMPIVFVAIFRKLGITRPHVDYEAGSPLKRIETNASTGPMLRENSMATTVIFKNFHFELNSD